MFALRLRRPALSANLRGSAMQRPDIQDAPLLRLLPGRDRRVKAGHPWAFSNEIAMDPAAKALPPGGLVRLEGDDGVRHGAWQFNPHSLIAVRRLSRDPAAAIDAAWLRERLAAALALRERLYAAPFYRLVHAEADGLPGLVVDRYGDALAVQANTAGMDLLTPALLEAMRGLLAPRAVVARNDAAVRALEGLPQEVRPLLGDAASRCGRRKAASASRWTCSAARRPAGSSTSARTATAWPNSPRAARRCWTPSATPAPSASAAPPPARRASCSSTAAPTPSTSRRAPRRRTAWRAARARRAEALDELERMAAAGAGERFDIVVADPPAFAKAGARTRPRR